MSDSDEKAAIEAAVANLETQFTRWKEEVKRLLNAAVSYAKKVGDTHRLGGKTLEEMIAIVKGWIADHIKASNPHQTTAAMIDAYTTAEVDDRVDNYFPRNGLRITKIVAPTATIASGKLSVAALAASHIGYGFTIPAATLALTGTAAQYLLVTLNTDSDAPTGVFSIGTDVDIETTNDCIIILGVITSASGVYSVVTEGVVRLGRHRLSPTLYGDGIPVSPGVPTTTGTIDSGWFAS